MAWWRQKADEHHGEDNILDLDTIVWRGINQFDRMHRLAEAAERAEQNDPPVVTPTSEPLPSVPLPVQVAQDTLPVERSPVDRSPVERPVEDDAALADLVALAALEAEADNRSPQEEMIEEEIRQQIISDAMNAVLAFQDGGSRGITASSPGDDAIQQQLETRLEANVEQELHDHLDQYSPQPPAASGPEMTGAIRDVIADEIGLWLKDNMARIVAETLMQMTPPPVEETPKAAPKAGAKKTAKKAASKTAPKASPKASKKTTAKAKKSPSPPKS